jgi:hypothetical protein
MDLEMISKFFIFTPYYNSMQKALIYFTLGTVLSFLINYFFISSENIALDIFYAIAFGLAWGLSYYLDTPKFTLIQKLLSSFAAMGLLVLAGAAIFNLELAIPAILKFSTVFVAYYLIASFRGSKSLRK